MNTTRWQNSSLRRGKQDHNSASLSSQKKKGSSVTARLMKELSEIMLSTDKSVTAFPDEANTFSWIGKIKGPINSVYEGLAFKMTLDFPENYPYEAPTIKFASQCFHPNVDTKGNICLDTLKERWSSCNSVQSILLSIQSLLQDPNVDSPLNTQAATLWQDQEEYKRVLWDTCKEARQIYEDWS